ncbi:glycosyl transferase family 4 [Mangrovibacterium marinum]|uniref:Glycosyl transferase family 4 n=1 Tax=Mangrovibacterium marinum TaxID=1639118 RepID=A0A2T5BTS7_9BACT|nr:glycosyltransferase family 1 protein [Mangrovibacterium marinum]PTN02880.1 glycosyl transferase family 4 [Mangrovibacterium marinum]
MIFVNARFLTQKITGVQRFAIEISIRLKNSLKDEIQFVAPKNILHEEIAQKLNVSIVGKTRGHQWEQVTLPLYLKKQKSPLLLNLCNTAPINYSNNIVTVHDLAFLAHPKWFSWKFRLFYKFLIPKIIDHAKKVITVSQFSKDEIIKRLSTPENKISIVHNAVSDNLIESKKCSSKSNFILFVGSQDPRKNIQSIIQAMKYLPPEIHLKLVGGKADSFNEQLNEIPKEIRHRIHLTGYLPDKELNRLYKDANAFVYPSHYEGFGLPPLEAQALSCPVVVSDIPVFREILKDSATYCNQNDPSDIANKINLICNQTGEERNSMIEKGRRNVERFSWGESAAIIEKIITHYC